MAGVTIKDVARAANVSVATVSRALNGHDNVTAEVRRRVAAIAEQMRYSPHAAARSLSSRRTHAIGVVLPDLYGEFFSELVRGIDQVARERLGMRFPETAEIVAKQAVGRALHVLHVFRVCANATQQAEHGLDEQRRLHPSPCIGMLPLCK